MSETAIVTQEQQGLATTQVEPNLGGFLKTLIDSKKLPVHIKTVEEAFTIVQMGRELGFATMQAFHYIIPIQGRLSLSAKAIGALLRKGGVKFTTKEDFVNVYKDGERTADEKPVDRRTTIVFIRGDQVEETSFYWTDAIKAGLDTKDNWKRMPRDMMYARTLSRGANRIGQDLLLGLYMTEELTDSLNVAEASVVREEDGTIVEVVNEG